MYDARMQSVAGERTVRIKQFERRSRLREYTARANKIPMFVHKQTFVEGQKAGIKLGKS